MKFCNDCKHIYHYQDYVMGHEDDDYLCLSYELGDPDGYEIKNVIYDEFFKKEMVVTPKWCPLKKE